MPTIPLRTLHKLSVVSISPMALLMLCSGCATFGRAGKIYRHRKLTLQADLPAGWLRYYKAKRGFVMTRDGLGLETIEIYIDKVGKKLEGTERTYRADMLPHEIAELSLNLIESLDETNDFQVNGIELATIAGRDAYRADASFKTEGGLRKRLRMYGARIEDHVCEFQYVAEDEVYYDKYIKVFEDMISSVTIGDRDR